ncbi:MAG: hydantoinase B/oxoprolinase family protein [Pseudomonadota bacterium]
MKPPFVSSDPVTFEILRSSFYSICEEMKSVIMRAAFSPLISLSSDLSCALADATGRVIAQGNDIAVHLGAMPYSIKGALESISPSDLRPGDAILTNDVYRGGSHLPDMTLISPIFVEEDLVGYAVNRTHWPDVGGSAPGSSSVNQEIYQEGIRIPPVIIFREGRLDPQISSILFANVRVPEERRGDLHAQFAGNMRGLLRVEELVRRYGLDCVRRVMEETLGYSQYLIESEICHIPDGTYSFEEYMDGDGYGAGPDGQGLRLCAKVTVNGNSVTVDFTGSAPATKGPVNAPFAVTASSVYYTLLAVTNPDIPPNSGCYEPIKIIAPKGSIVCAEHPSPVVSANTETSNRIVDVLLGALSQAIPERVIAGSYGSACIVTMGGINPRTGSGFVHYETVGGGMGARPESDGINGHRVHMGNTMNVPVEAIEAAYPIRIVSYELIGDSGGNGKYRGGWGVRRVYEALEPGIRFSVLCERSLHPPWGLLGGRPGKRASFYTVDPAGVRTLLDSKVAALELPRGHRLFVETAGGGGYGIPEEQDPPMDE